MRAALLVPVAVLALLAGAGAALPAQDPGALRDRAERAGARERALEDSVARLAALDRRLERQAAALERRRTAVQADLDRDEARLAAVRADLRRERARAARLRTRLAEARRVLTTRLVERYKAADVDVLSVVLDAAGFADLLERAAFLRRIQTNDEQIVQAVRRARAAAIRERRRLDRAEARQGRVVAGLRARRAAIASMAAGAAQRRDALGRMRAARTAALGAARADRRRARRRLRDAQQAAERASATAAAPAGAGPWAIPWSIVQCESGGQNLPPNAAGASGYYQILPETWRSHGGRGAAAHLAPKAEQDRVARRIWAGGQGPGAWVCTGLVG